jgi:hypothetical protein
MKILRLSRHAPAARLAGRRSASRREKHGFRAKRHVRLALRLVGAMKRVPVARKHTSRIQGRVRGDRKATNGHVRVAPFPVAFDANIHRANLRYDRTAGMLGEPLFAPYARNKFIGSFSVQLVPLDFPTGCPFVPSPRLCLHSNIP